MAVPHHADTQNKIRYRRHQRRPRLNDKLSGVFEEFRLAVKDHYRPHMDSDPVFGIDLTMVPHIDGRSDQANDPREGGRWEPHVADQILKRMLAEIPNVEIFYNRFPVDVVMAGNRIAGVVTEKSAGTHAYAPAVEGQQVVFHGKVIIDATHEGDIAAWAGVPYRVGREARSPLEPHAGDIVFYNHTGEFIDRSGGQDRAVVSYGVRLCGKINDAPPERPLDMPPGYDPQNYEPSAHPTVVAGSPNGKFEVNANPIGNELQEVNWAWPEADRAERARLYEVYREHAIGFLYHLRNAYGQHVGLAEDEFPDNGHVPYRLFVREARRIVGETTVTEADVNPFVHSATLQPPLRRDSVAVGHYPIDSKPVRSKTDMSTPDKGAGDFFLVNCSSPFQVPYGAIVPVGVDGLLVPAAFSATHVAYSAMRMDPTWTALGQAAGVAAVISIQQRVPVRRVPIDLVQGELIGQKSKLLFFWDLPADHPAFFATQWLSLRGIVEGYPDRSFRPDQLLTRAEMAAILFRGLELWPSVSEVHFTDLPYHHWAFRYLETLFDNAALDAFGVTPLWPEVGRYDPLRDAGFQNANHDRFGEILPDKTVTWGEVLQVVQALAKWPDTAKDGAAGRHGPSDQVTRGEFCALVAALVGDVP